MIVINAFVMAGSAVLGTVPPTFVNAGTTSTANTPAYPGSIVSGNYLELTVYNADLGSPNTPSGWTQLHSHQYDNGNPAVMPRCTTFYKVATGSESGTVTITYTGTAGRSVAVICQYSGVNTSGGPYETLSFNAHQTSGPSTPMASLPLTLARNGSLVLNKYWTFTGVTGGMLASAGAGWTEEFDLPNGGAGLDVTGSITSKGFASAGTTAIENPTHTVGIEYATVSYALKSPDS